MGAVAPADGLVAPPRSLPWENMQTWDDTPTSARRRLDPGGIEHPLRAPALGPRRHLGAKPLIEPKAHPVQFLGWQRLRQPPHCRLSLGEVGAECLLDVGVGAPGRCRFAVLGSAQSLGSFNNADIPTKQVDSRQGGACAARFLAPGHLAHVLWLFLGFEADGAGFD